MNHWVDVDRFLFLNLRTGPGRALAQHAEPVQNFGPGLRGSGGTTGHFWLAMFQGDGQYQQHSLTFSRACCGALRVTNISDVEPSNVIGDQIGTEIILLARFRAIIQESKTMVDVLVPFTSVSCFLKSFLFVSVIALKGLEQVVGVP